MTGPAIYGAAALSVLAMALAPAPAKAASDPLAAYAWKSRVLLAVALKADDPKLVQQRATYRAMGKEARSRDLILVEIVGQTAQSTAIRKRFDLDPTGFHALLIGKDGGDKLTSDQPLPADALLPLIDAMPMRQQEMRRRS